MRRVNDLAAVLLVTLVLALTAACHSVEEPAEPDPERVEAPSRESAAAERRRKAHAQAEGASVIILPTDEELEAESNEFESLAGDGGDDSRDDDAESSEPGS